MIPIIDAYYDGSHGITFYECTKDRNNPIGAYLAHTWNNLFLIPMAKPRFADPKKKEYITDLTGADGSVDSSSALTGYPLYNNREGSFSFCVVSYDYHDDNPLELLDGDDEMIFDAFGEPILVASGQGHDIVQTWAEKCTQLSDMFNGRELIAILDDDPEYYYRGFYNADVQSASDGMVLTLEYRVEPYKTKIISDTKALKYHQYDFFSHDPDVPAPESVIFIPSRMPTILEFKMDANNIAPEDAKIAPRFSFENPETGRKTVITLSPNATNEFTPYTTTSAVITNTTGRNTIKITPIVDEAYLQKYHISVRFREGDL